LTVYASIGHRTNYTGMTGNINTTITEEAGKSGCREFFKIKTLLIILTD
jgi:hypothetical protein